MAGRRLLKKFGPKIKARGDKFVCHYCGIKLKKGAQASQPKIEAAGFGFATIDHKQPESKGGKTIPKNLVFACSQCNHEKDDMTYDEYMSLIRSRHGRKY